jgi:hypothetical protein
MSVQGDVVVFTKLDSADWTLPQNQDRIADSVWITRKHNQSIFNIALDSGMTNNSPLHTLWSRNSILNTEMDDFTTFRSMHNNNPQSLIGDTVSLYLQQYGMYFNLLFSSFSGGNSGGGFSYSREEVFPTHLKTIRQNNLLTNFKLEQNYPNPFNPLTTIKFDVGNVSSKSELNIYNILGENVATILNKRLRSGSYKVQWDASSFSSGVYFSELISGGKRVSKKMILLK